MYKKAFTLAEVLITLTIIGIIAALTIPNLMKKYTNHANYVALKKGYSTLNNVYKLVEKEYGTADTWNLSKDNIEEVADYFLQHMKYRKKCVQHTGCWIEGNKFKNIGNSFYPLESGGTIYTTANLDDGTIVSFHFSSVADFVPWGSNPLGVYDAGRLSNGLTPVIYYDVNGIKGPNQFGRDIFAFVVTLKGLVPAGRDDTSDCSVTETGWGKYGMTCTYKVLQEGGIYY